MISQTNQISVCICTYKRPQLLKQLLEKLCTLDTFGSFTYSIVVVDNDGSQSAQAVVAEFARSSPVPVKYCVEPRQNIALARNRALQNADSNLIAFIDDDEFPDKYWLCNSLQAYFSYGVSGILGPVKPHFECEPPRWVKKGRFFDRPTHSTGYQMSFSETRTGNVLFGKAILSDAQNTFNPEFGTGGEDVDFFRRMMEKGCRFVWCNEAVVYEIVPSSRCKLSYLLKRAILRGSNFPKHRTHQVRNVTKSLIAVPCYALALPVLALLGQHLFIRYLIKLCDHASRLLAFLGFKILTEREM
jgi:GT2 family glycosyltransferase